MIQVRDGQKRINLRVMGQFGARGRFFVADFALFLMNPALCPFGMALAA
jgi:hypothetical protein